MRTRAVANIRASTSFLARRSAWVHMGLRLATLMLIILLAGCSGSPTTAQPSPAVVSDWPSTVTVLARQLGDERATKTSLQTAIAETLTPSATSTPLPTPTSTVSDDKRLMDSYLEGLVDSGAFNGAVLVAQNGRVVLRAGYGLANADYAIVNAPDTRFRLGSITKQFTAMAVLLLQTRGRLRVEDPICRYLANCPDAWQPITIHQLLTHTSGIPNYTGTPAFAVQEPWPTTPEEIVAPLRDRELLFTPGDGFAYSNANYVLLGMIIERVSGQSYETFLRDAIFEPLGMHDTGVEQARAVLPHRAVGYIDRVTEATYLDLSNLFAAGALYSTIDDLYRWDRALAANQLIPAELQMQMSTPVQETYAYGWRVTETFGRHTVGHTGHVSGFHTDLTRYPDDDAVVIVLSNFEYADVQTISLHLAALLFHMPEPTPASDSYDWRWLARANDGRFAHLAK